MARLFVAVDVDAALQDAVAAAFAPVDMRRVRLVPTHQLHLTLRFLGETAPERVGDVVSALEAAAARHASFAVDVVGAGTFGRPRSPRVVWAGIDDAAPLDALARDVEDALVAQGFPRADKPFRAHLTLGRGKEGARVDVEALRAVGAVGTLRVDEVVLYESALSRSGAVHTARARVPLVAPVAGGR